MDVDDVLGLLEFLDYFVRPWRFAFSSYYRSECLRVWQESGWGRRLLLASEALISMALGVALPAWLIYHVRAQRLT